jgi:DNA-binding LacI/PurR family transcriptional regulator
MGAPGRITLATLADDLGVSRATVSNAYNRPDQLSADLRDRILARAEALGFPGPDPAARSLRRGRVGAVGVLLDEPLSYAFSDPAAVLLLDGMARELEGDNVALLLLAGNQPGPAPAAVRQAVVDGWIVQSLGEKSPSVAAAAGRHQPLVVLDQPTLAGVPTISLDDEGGTRAATDYLLRLGHRHLAVVTFAIMADGRQGPVSALRRNAATYPVTGRRLAGVAAAVRAAGLVWEQVPVVETAHNDPASGAEAARVLLEDDRRPTAIVALSDQLALGVLHAARKAGLSVPDDLSIVGFDDTPPSALADPPLTTVHQPLVERGQAAGRLLGALLAGEHPALPEPFPTHLVLRGSTAPPPTIVRTTRADTGG